MSEFKVVAQTMRDGEWWLLIETSRTRAGCLSCGVIGGGNGRRRVLVRDLPIAGTPVVLVWAKRTWRCREPLCERGSWSETSDEIGVRASLTERARREICRRVGADLDTVAEVAREFGVGWFCAHQAVVDYGDQLIASDRRLELVTGLGVDEHTFQHSNATRRTQMVTTFVDIDRGRLLVMVPGRSGAVVREWVQAQPLWWADQIRVATIDAFAGYAAAIRDTLPEAVLVVDHFHAIRLASEAVNDVRRRVQQATTGHRGRKGDALYGIRRLPLMTWRNLNDKGWDRLRAGLAAGDPDGEIAAVWLARELLSEVYNAHGLAHARRRLIVFFQHAANAEVPELTRLARTIDRWSNEVLAYHSTGGASNGPPEAVNFVIEKIRRIGHGYPNYDNYRRRLLLGCGIKWTTVPTHRIRGRQPAFAA
ncbi:MAG: ISL3 family transposase [Ilumatobacteraceae bacterium]|nr:ISL3 family transposase [Ilumatobacteraceae bacterium]